MFSLLVSLVVFLSCQVAIAEQHPPPPETKPATLMSGLGQHHHAITTTNPEAQRFFDQGLALVYGFNHEEAVRSFQRAAELDPQAAMPWWGIALALGPNINLDVDPTREKAAYEAVQKAQTLAVKAPENERAYINALAKRYSIDPKADLKKLAVDYKNAMGELGKRYPDDLDAATLYAESAMDLRPWQLWTLDGKPAPGTQEIVAILESVLTRDPYHPGANHYYIHAVEASPHPERALPSAARLETLVPAAGHLVHMPSHIYIRTGDYAASAKSNAVAVEVDRTYLQDNNVQGVYPLMYYSHNLHFLSVSHGMAGRFADAKQAADQLAELVAPAVKEMPMVEFFLPTPTFVLLRFQRWNDILQVRAPDPSLPVTNLVWHFSRSLAYAATGDVPNAESERKAFSSAAKAIPPDALFSATNKAGPVLHVAEAVVDAKIAMARGAKKQAIAYWRKAVAAQDALAYDEPPAWYYPVRESLGGALLMDGQYQEAEKVFRADLQRNPRNGRSLFGLLEALKAQKKTADAEWVQKAFAAAWQNADSQLRPEDL
jgi:tetratricopeptide (TPR) repeat protein